MKNFYFVKGYTESNVAIEHITIIWTISIVILIGVPLAILWAKERFKK